MFTIYLIDIIIMAFLIFILLLIPLQCFSIHIPQEKIEKWRIIELDFESANDSSNNIELDVCFSTSSGDEIVRPAFWDGGKTYKVRFAPTKTGIWHWRTVCPNDASIKNKSGEIECVSYKGDLDIYKHGFVNIAKGHKHFSYADGTPFFYLGDTHWSMYREEYDDAGPHLNNGYVQSHFKYIVDRRVEQGFTVYQSEPIDAPFNIADGTIDSKDIPGFKEADKYYQYIADAGLVHVNAEFFYVGKLTPEICKDSEKLRKLARYWVARYGAYPVMWSLAQECDNDFYSNSGTNKWYDYRNNPWIEIAQYIHKYDAYSHPLSAHQENTVNTTVTGLGSKFYGMTENNGGASVFLDNDIAVKCGHNWWAAQWSPSLTSKIKSSVVRDYWNSERPAVNYEGRYCGLWTKDYGARAQAWISFLSGFCGYGYGAADIWLYKSNYDTEKASWDGIDSISIADKKAFWPQTVEYESANQMKYLRYFLTGIKWWKLTPIFPDEKKFIKTKEAVAYALSDQYHILYFYNRNNRTGAIEGLPHNSRIWYRWFNPRNGRNSKKVYQRVGKDGKFVLPSKPDKSDWVLLINNT